MNSAFRLGDWIVQPQRDRIVNAGNETRVEPRAMQVLVYLAEHAGEVVTREQILEKVWEGTFVGDEVLTSAIRKLRQAFGEDGGDAELIQTVPKKGYRLNALVEPSDEDPRPRSMAVVSRRAAFVVGFLGLVVGGLVSSIFSLNAVNSVHPSPTTKFTISLSSDAPYAGDLGGVAMSPDGSRIAYLVVAGGVPHLYLRHLDQLDARPVSGTSTASAPFFSPDGEWVAFFAPWRNELKKVSLRGGPPITLCEAHFAAGGSWVSDEKILFVTRDASARKTQLLRVSDTGGTPEVIATLDGSSDRLLYGWPQMLPGGKAVLLSGSRGSTLDNARIVVVSLRTGEAETLIEPGYYGKYSPSGHLVYVVDGMLMAAPFDIDRLELRGPSKRIVTDALAHGSSGASFAFSANGNLVYVSQTSVEHTLTWVNREGREIANYVDQILDNPRQFRLSPDGSRLAVVIGGVGYGDIWIYDRSGRPPHPVDVRWHEWISHLEPGWFADRF